MTLTMTFPSKVDAMNEKERFVVDWQLRAQISSLHRAGLTVVEICDRLNLEATGDIVKAIQSACSHSAPKRRYA